MAEHSASGPGGGRGAAAGGGGNFLQLAAARPQPSANRSTEDVRRSMLHRREKSGCILMRCSGGFVRILKDGTVEWKKGATTSTSSLRARSDDRDDDEDPSLRACQLQSGRLRFLGRVPLSLD